MNQLSEYISTDKGYLIKYNNGDISSTFLKCNKYIWDLKIYGNVQLNIT